MATLDELKLQQLLRPFEGPGGIASLNPLAFQFQNQSYPQSNNTMAKNIMSNFQNQLYPQSEEMRDAQILMNQPNYVKTNRVEDPAFSILNLAGYDYDPYLATKDPYNYNYDIGTRPAFLRTNTPLDMNRFQGVSDMSLIDETTNDEQDQNYTEQVEKSRNPLSGILDLLRNIPTPFNLVRRGLESLRGSESLSDFRNSRTGAEFFKRRRDREALARDPDVFKDARNITSNLRRTAADNIIDRGRGESNIASRAPRGPTGARRGIDSRNRSSIDPAKGRKG